MKTRLCPLCAALLVVCIGSQVARAGFSTHDGNPDLSGHLSMVASSVSSPNQALFRFTNLVGIPSSICDICFGDGSPLGIASLSSSAGVRRPTGAAPANLPGGQTLTPPVQCSSPNEWSAADSDSPVSADGSLRVGLHVQSIGPRGDSDRCVNVVPAPAAVTLGATGLALAYFLRRTRS